MTKEEGILIDRQTKDERDAVWKLKKILSDFDYREIILENVNLFNLEERRLARISLNNYKNDVMRRTRKERQHL
jgi:hypothetical protein